jgi:Na+-driven multidrug efflux pump
VLRIEAFAEPLFAVSIVAFGCLVGAGDTKVPAALNMLSMWGVRLTLAAWLAPKYGLVGVWIAMATELCVRGLLMLARLLSGRWLRLRSLAESAN